jgi:hypothetical protein
MNTANIANIVWIHDSGVTAFPVFLIVSKISFCHRLVSTTTVWSAKLISTLLTPASYSQNQIVINCALKSFFKTGIKKVHNKNCSILPCLCHCDINTKGSQECACIYLHNNNSSGSVDSLFTFEFVQRFVDCIRAARARHGYVKLVGALHCERALG